MSASTGVLFYGNNSRVLNVSGSAISVGSEAPFTPPPGGSFQTHKLDASHLILSTISSTTFYYNYLEISGGVMSSVYTGSVATGVSASSSVGEVKQIGSKLVTNFCDNTSKHWVIVFDPLTATGSSANTGTNYCGSMYSADYRTRILPIDSTHFWYLNSDYMGSPATSAIQIDITSGISLGASVSLPGNFFFNSQTGPFYVGSEYGSVYPRYPVTNVSTLAIGPRENSFPCYGQRYEINKCVTLDSGYLFNSHLGTRFEIGY